MGLLTGCVCVRGCQSACAFEHTNDVYVVFFFPFSVCLCAHVCVYLVCIQSAFPRC